MLTIGKRPYGALWVALVTTGLVGCAGRHSIIAATGTNIGVEISQSPSTQAPYAKLGYQRTEFAIVPTNRSADIEAGDAEGGAKGHGDVLMELRYGGIFDTGPSSGIYQRLAVGFTAVQQPGASLMFARDADGGLSANAAAAVLSAKSITEPVAVEIAKTQLAIAEKRDCKAANAATVDAAIRATGKWSTYEDFRDGNPMPTAAEAKGILDQLGAVTCGV